jgi:hypothetical protein
VPTDVPEIRGAGRPRRPKAHGHANMAAGIVDVARDLETFDNRATG